MVFFGLLLTIGYTQRVAPISVIFISNLLFFSIESKETICFVHSKVDVTVNIRITEEFNSKSRALHFVPEIFTLISVCLPLNTITTRV